MSFRIEKKIYIKKEHLLEFKKFLSENNVKKLHNSRDVESTYFENRFNQIYIDSIEGLCPRKKIRVRSYPDNLNKDYFLELKISSIEGRYKTNKKISEKERTKMFKYGVFDKKYGKCLPKLNVRYKRNYYFNKDVRVTLDTNIQYKIFNSSIVKKDPNVIVELKTNINKSIDELFEKYPFQEIRFSKYCNGLQLTQNF